MQDTAADTRPDRRATAAGFPLPRELLRYLPAAGALIAFVWFLTFAGGVAEGRVFEWSRPWIPALGIEFAFRLDGLGLVFALLISGIGALIFLYTAAYFAEDARLGRLLTLLVLFALSMLGLVLADDFVTLFLFWEGTTITSFLLVGFDYQKDYARRAALQALLVTGLGGLALLAALVTLGAMFGTYRISEVLAEGEALKASAAYLPVLFLILLAAFTKSAQFPFHFWLPGAMAAPTPVSAYLHSATMVKAGVYLLARMTPAMGGTEIWFWMLTVFGAITMLIGSIWAIRQTDLKQMLAHTTVMGLGTLVMLLGGGTKLAVEAAALFLVVHALYKASLFLMVGCLDKKAGTREVDALGGLRSVMPLTAAAAALAALSMAGIYPFVGFLGKEIIYDASRGVLTEPVLVTGAALVANATMVALAMMLAIRPFYGARKSPKPAADPGWMMLAGPGALAVLGLVLGVLPGVTGHFLVGPMTGAILGEPFEAHLKLWHGINLPLILSIATFALGASLFFGLRSVRRGLTEAEAAGLTDSDRGYDRVLAGVEAAAAAVTGRIQTGLLAWYMKATFLFLAVLLWGAIVLSEGPKPEIVWSLPIVTWATLLLILVGTGLVVVSHSRLTTITALGAVGAGIALVFVLYGAIDVAMTQLMVEILVVVFIAIAMVRLPRAPERQGFRVGDAGIAGAAGFGVTLVLLSVVGGEMPMYVTDFYEAASVPEAKGHNIVNVILVDFRALDTLGEISVIVIASIAAVAALVAGRRTKGQS